MGPGAGPGVSELGGVNPDPKEKLGPGMSYGSTSDTGWVMVVVPVDPLCPEAWEETRVGCTIHCRS